MLVGKVGDWAATDPEPTTHLSRMNGTDAHLMSEFFTESQRGAMQSMHDAI